MTRKDWFDIGHGVRVQITWWYGDDDEHEFPSGLVEEHDSVKTGERCRGSVQFDSPRNREKAGNKGSFWTVESLDPLTISPSVLCSCGHHGFIRDGKWVPA